MARLNVKQSINEFLKEREPERRYSSFDYCFNYFHKFFEDGMTKKLCSDGNLEKSCLHLGFYLASWGMYRGSSFLLKEKSVRHYANLITEISKPKNVEYWKIDVDNYTDDNITLLMGCKEMIKDSLEIGTHNYNILVTKIMLGVYGNTPAFDVNFKAGIKKEGLAFKVNTFNEDSLKKVNKFYLNHKRDFDNKKVYTVDFITGKNTNILYTKAKLIDMAAFQIGSTTAKK